MDSCDKIITLADVALACRLSVCTVSKALSGRGSVSEATALRVKEAAARLGYVPNEAAKILAGRRAYPRSEIRPAIAVLRFDSRLGDSEEWRKNQGELQGLAAAQGLELHFADRDGYPSAKRMGEVLWAQGVQGLILLGRWAPNGYAESNMAGFPWEKFSLVKVSRGLDWLRCHTVCESAGNEIRRALEWGVAAGCRRILTLLGVSVSSEDDWARLGILHAFRELHADDLDCLEIHRLVNRPGDELKKIRQKLKAVKPDLVIGFPVWKCWLMLEGDGYRMPEDFSFVGLPVHSIKRKPGMPRLTGPLQDFVDIEFPAALGVLQDELRAGRRGFPSLPYEHVLPSAWQDGISTRQKGG